MCKETGFERPLLNSRTTIPDLEATVGKIYLLGLLYVGMSLVHLIRAVGPMRFPDDRPATVSISMRSGPVVDPTDAASWFRSVKAYCNPVEVGTRLALNPAPRSPDGTAYEAACFALAGQLDSARERILQLPHDERWTAAGVVFNVGHPVADAGDDRAAGPIMELVVEFWPNHYMALYHAGASRYALGDHAPAHRYLVSFLEHYTSEDGWRRNAKYMISQMENS